MTSVPVHRPCAMLCAIWSVVKPMFWSSSLVLILPYRLFRIGRFRWCYPDQSLRMKFPRTWSPGSDRDNEEVRKIDACAVKVPPTTTDQEGSFRRMLIERAFWAIGKIKDISLCTLHDYPLAPQTKSIDVCTYVCIDCKYMYIHTCTKYFTFSLCRVGAWHETSSNNVVLPIRSANTYHIKSERKRTVERIIRIRGERRSNDEASYVILQPPRRRRRTV